MFVAIVVSLLILATGLRFSSQREFNKIANSIDPLAAMSVYLGGANPAEVFGQEKHNKMLSLARIAYYSKLAQTAIAVVLFGAIVLAAARVLA